MEGKPGTFTRLVWLLIEGCTGRCVMPESQNELLENAENTGGPEGAGDTALRYEAGFFGLKNLVKKSGVTAVEAATRILQVSSTLVSSYRVDDLANILSTAEELNAHKPVYHPFGI